MTAPVSESGIGWINFVGCVKRTVVELNEFLSLSEFAASQMQVRFASLHAPYGS